jgi:membrane protein YqaA with SNARE-associated domain
MEALAPYGALFASAFIAATLLPAQSELLLAGLVAAGKGDPLLLLIVGTVGNTAGAVVNWTLGRGAAAIVAGRRLPAAGRETYARASRAFDRYGQWSLLFAWLPVVGDVLTVVAGAARVSLANFVLLVAIGKAARYAAILGGSLWLVG